MQTKSLKYKTLEQISAGGAAFRHNGETFEVAIVAVNPSRRWQLPKGLIDAGETPETTAVREVREEAGIETKILAPIDVIEYWYFGQQSGESVRFHKLVHFFLLSYLSGTVENHDSEVLEARWVAPAEAVEMLAFKSEKAVVEKASKMLLDFAL